jgi:hypothetical protein
MRTFIICHGAREKPQKTLDEEEKERQRRKNLIRVFTPTRGCFIYKHKLLGLSAKTRPVNNRN